MNVWKCKLIFPTCTQQQNIEITDLKQFFLAAENTSVLISLAPTVFQKLFLELDVSKLSKRVQSLRSKLVS